MRIGFVIPPMNNFRGAIALIASIKTKHHPRIYIEEQYRHQKPLAAAWNHGFDRAVEDGCEYVFILNDDVLFAPDTVDNLIKEFERLPDDVVLVSCNNIKGNLSDPYDILTLPEKYEPGDVDDHPNYSCFAVRKDFFEKVGRFDENFVPAWCEDQDSHQRIHLLGLRAVVTTASSCVHFGQVSTNLTGPADSGRSVAYFMKKWGSHNNNPPQLFTHPYNDENLSPKEWIQNYE